MVQGEPGGHHPATLLATTGIRSARLTLAISQIRTAASKHPDQPAAQQLVEEIDTATGADDSPAAGALTRNGPAAPDILRKAPRQPQPPDTAAAATGRPPDPDTTLSMTTQQSNMFRSPSWHASSRSNRSVRPMNLSNPGCSTRTRRWTSSRQTSTPNAAPDCHEPRSPGGSPATSSSFAACATATGWWGHGWVPASPPI